jgi:electron transfer flavoprotein alpha/beta subunit
MKIAVCVKYVPVVAQMGFDYATKTMLREGVPPEINPFDRLGLLCATGLTAGPADEVLAVSMGPPQAREGLLHCLALGADRAVLLTDRALAGSDTFATACALALLLAREQPDLILCGRNSTDAETGQVGPELAELLGLPHLSQVRRLTYEAAANRIVAERTTDEGYQVVACPLPALVCVTEGVARERYALPQEIAAAQATPVEEVTCAHLTSDLSLFGLEGSPAWVADIRLVAPNRLGVVITEQDATAAAQQVVALVRERLARLATAAASADVQVGTRRYPAQRRESQTSGVNPLHVVQPRALRGKGRRVCRRGTPLCHHVVGSTGETPRRRLSSRGRAPCVVDTATRVPSCVHCAPRPSLPRPAPQGPPDALPLPHPARPVQTARRRAGAARGAARKSLRCRRARGRGCGVGHGRRDG